MSRQTWILLLMLVATLGGLGLGRLYIAGQTTEADTVVLEAGTWFSPARPLPGFQLVDQDGRTVGPERFQGRWSLVFFGFTHCPEACPATLALLATVRQELARSMPADRVPDVMLVSVDPERDTPEILKAYLSGFDGDFTGLTGEPAAVREFATTLGVPYQKTPMDGDYMIDHSLAIMLVNPEGQRVALFSAPHTADVLLRDYRACMAKA